LAWYTPVKLIELVLKLNACLQDYIPFSNAIIPSFSVASKVDIPFKYVRSVDKDIESEVYLCSKGTEVDDYESIEVQGKDDDTTKDENFPFGKSPTAVLSLDGEQKVSYPYSDYTISVGFCIALFLDFRVRSDDNSLFTRVVESTYLINIESVYVALIDLLDWFVSKNETPALTKPTSSRGKGYKGQNKNSGVKGGNSKPSKGEDIDSNSSLSASASSAPSTPGMSKSPISGVSGPINPSGPRTYSTYITSDIHDLT
jgi:hypothetical protein